MKKNTVKFLYVFSGLLVLLLAVYLILVPKLVNLNSYKVQIINNTKTQTGLGLNIENINFKTNINLSVDVFADNIKVNYPNDKKLLSIDSASVNVPLLPLLFKNFEIKAVKLNNPEINLAREEDGKYSIESILKNNKASTQKQDFKLVKGIDIEVKNYKFNIDNYFYKTPQKFVLSGNLIKISDFNPEKYIKLETKGKLFVQDKPNVNFDIKLRSQLPFGDISESKTQNKNIDPLDAIIKYNFKSNIIADISLNNVRKDIDIDGFINFDGLSLKIQEKTLPDSYGKIKFKGKSFNIDTKLYINPQSYISAVGNIKDINKNKMNLSVKTSEIDLKDLKDFIDAINEVSSANITSLNDSAISGKIIANFKIMDNSGFDGYLNIFNTNIMYKGLSSPVKNFNSAVKFESNKLIFNNTGGFIDNNKFDISGFIDKNNNADLKLNINSLNIKSILDLVNKSSLLKDVKPQLKDISSLSGVIKVETTVKGNLKEKLFPDIRIFMINPAFVHKQAGFPVSLNKGTIFINKNQIQLNGVQANVLQSPVLISGNIEDYSAKTPKPEIFVKIPAFNMSKIKSLSNSKILDKNSKNLLYSIKNPSGFVSANIKVSPDQSINADMNINNVSAYYTPAKLPVRIINGTLITDGKKLEIKFLNLNASNSPIKLSGTVTSIAKLPELDLKVIGFISAADIKKYSSPDIKKSIAIRGNVPISASIAGYVDGWKLNSQARIDNISYIANINTSGSKILNVNLKGTPSSVSFFDSGLSSSGGKIISISGGINQYSSKNPVLNNLKVSLSNLNLSLVNPQGKLNVNGTVSLSGTSSNPKTTGNISVKNISVPSMYLTSNNINLALKNNEFFIYTGNLNVLDSKFKINMALENNLSSTLIVKNINVSSDYINADRLQKAFPAVPNQDFPVIVKKGKFSADKMVLNGLQANNVGCDFAINPMNIMKITDLIAQAAGGTARGKVNMNLKTSRVALDINTSGMDINTLASEFANMPNEIYGDMNGNIDISTYGYTPQQTSNNAAGTITFTVANGKLKKLGSISHLLKARNLLSGGFSYQTIDNIASFREASDSNQFKKLTGDISINNGIININELTAQGGDMSLYSKGSIRMSNNYAEITTLGTLSDRISSKLSKIPDLSLEKLVTNRILNKLPGQWGQVITDLRPAKPQYPDIEKIPSLTRGSQQTDKHFIVKIQGNFYNPSSVKSFKVIN